MLRGPFIKPKWINIQNPWMSVSHLDGLFKLHILPSILSLVHIQASLWQLSCCRRSSGHVPFYTYSQPGQPAAIPCHIQLSRETLADVLVTHLFTSETSCQQQCSAQLDHANSANNLHLYCCFLLCMRVTARLRSVMGPRWLRWAQQIQLRCAQGPSLPVAAAQQYRLTSHHQGNAE